MTQHFDRLTASSSNWWSVMVSGHFKFQNIQRWWPSSFSRIIPSQRSRFKISPKFKSTRYSLQPEFSNIHIKKVELVKRPRWDRRSQISGLVSACLIMAFFVVSAGSILLRLIATSYTVIWDPTRLLMSTLLSRQRRSLDKWKSLPNFMKSMRTFLEKLPNRILKIFGQLFEPLN